MESPVLVWIVCLAGGLHRSKPKKCGWMGYAQFEGSILPGTDDQEKALTKGG